MDVYVVDTSAFIRDASLLDKIDNGEVVIHTTVLEELDNIKHKNNSRGAAARKVADRLYELRNRGNFVKGIRHRHGMIRFDDRKPNTEEFLRFGFSDNKRDNLLLCVAKEIRQETGRRVVILLGDKLMALKSQMDEVETVLVKTAQPARRPPRNKGYRNQGQRQATKG